MQHAHFLLVILVPDLDMCICAGGGGVFSAPLLRHSVGRDGGGGWQGPSAHPSQRARNPVHGSQGT